MTEKEVSDAAAELRREIENLRSENEKLRTEASGELRVDSYKFAKIPPFYDQDPELWFWQVEGALHSANIKTQTAKANFICGLLPYVVAVCARDIISKSDIRDKFNRLKERIINAYASSAEARLRQLLKGEVLTDGKPSQILYRLQNLNDNRCDDAVIKSIFLDQLTPQCRVILAAASVTDLQAYAALADQVMETMNA
ncbi:uncharacterized protein LOC108632727, partial [Ceratina calcarata]|uniref:Uncharacterized protein LOC108632727 n=1 Tax=Ceratina calcarata TaxID=156304 RepID=A0AAJ7JHS3_9HYME